MLDLCNTNAIDTANRFVETNGRTSACRQPGVR